MLRRLGFACGALAIVGTLTAGCGHQKVPTVAFYADSLGGESEGYLRGQLQGLAVLHSETAGGSALCDAMEAIREDAEDDPAEIAIIQFSGNNITSCMQDEQGHGLEGDALGAKYQADTQEAVRILRDSGAVVYLIGSPIAALTFGAPIVNSAFQKVANEWATNGGGVYYVDAGAAVLDANGAYTPTLPCLPAETAESGCTNGQIKVRAPDGLHFCPPGLDANPDSRCPVWSSGAYRFASAIAEPVRERLQAS
jgi:hypothetical protein